MTSARIHFEVFCRKAADGPWALIDATENRAAAIEKAKTLVRKNEAVGAYVVKESQDSETGDYTKLKIFEAGQTEETSKSMSDKKAELPCFRPEDLYTHHARATIARLLSDYLLREKLTAIEMIHRADALEKLSATGTVLQHAIQKAAMAHSGSTGENVQSAVKQLNKLTAKATERLYKDSRADIFPKIPGGGIAAIYDTIKGSAQTDYLLSGSIARHLAETNSWGGKLHSALNLMTALPGDEEDRESCLDIIDHFVAEMLAGRTAIQDLLGEQPSPGTAVDTLAELFLGRIDPQSGTHQAGVCLLSAEFKRDKLPCARSAIGHRILAELKSPRRLEPDDLEAEVRLARRLATKMVMGQGNHLPLPDITEAFLTRSKRLVAGDAVDPFLAKLEDPGQRIDRLLFLEENIIGDENKRQLAALTEPVIRSHTMERFFVDGDGNPMEKLRTLTSFQKRVLKSGFQPGSKTTLAEGLDIIASRVEEKAGVLKKVCERTNSPLERTVTLLRLYVANTFTEGALGGRAKNLISKAMQEPSFLNTVAAPAQETDQARVNEFKTLIAKVDLTQPSAA